MPSSCKGKLLIASSNEVSIGVAPPSIELLPFQHTRCRGFIWRGYIALGPIPRMLKGARVKENVSNYNYENRKASSEPNVHEYFQDSGNTSHEETSD